MANIIREDADGLPTGTYDVFYYTVRGSRVVDTKAFDASVPDSRIASMKLDSDEIAHAVCRSQRGGAWICGSRKAEQALLRWLESHS